jgi:hypothetical protein
LFIQVLRGQAGFQIPKVTQFLEKLPKEIKTIAILALFGLVGLLATFGGEISFSAFLNNIIKGLMTGAVTLGLRSGVEQGIEGVRQLRKKFNEQKTEVGDGDQPQDPPAPTTTPQG